LGGPPLLVSEECDNGSLSDMLMNHTFELDPDTVLQMLRDIVKGMRFLHACEPPIVHGDLRAKKVRV
jgi:atrial natriuretic peptide receptor A